MEGNLIGQFKENAKVHFEMDYGDKKSVRAGNKAVDRMFELAQKLKTNRQLEEFISLLDYHENRVSMWVAHILLERVKVTGLTADKALSLITDIANGDDDLDSYGEKLWLERWHSEHK